jgi:flagellar biosynthesis protein FlhF
MTIKRFIDKDSRSALAQVRRELGPDAVIVSNKSVGDQVELVAALDIDEVERALAPEAAAEAGSADPQGLGALQRELGQLRAMVEGRLSPQAWQEVESQSSGLTALRERLARLGLSRELVQAITQAMPASDPLEENWQRALQMLVTRMPGLREDALLENGGVLAVLGATGVGKTTTLAKMAARYVQRYGAADLALICADSYRIGAQEQLQTFANYLDVPVTMASDQTALRKALRRYRDKRLILVDTAGMSQRDARLGQQCALLQSLGVDVRMVAVLPATAQLRAMHELVRNLSRESLDAAVVTKVDESTGLGAVLDVMARHQLPLAYISDGQRVPDDLAPATGRDLMRRALELLNESSNSRRPTAASAAPASAAAVV